MLLLGVSMGAFYTFQQKSKLALAEEAADNKLNHDKNQRNKPEDERGKGDP